MWSYWSHRIHVAMCLNIMDVRIILLYFLQSNDNIAVVQTQLLRDTFGEIDGSNDHEDDTVIKANAFKTAKNLTVSTLFILVLPNNCC